jgi:hypothetical protein
MEFSNEKSFGRGGSPRHFCCVLQSACGAGASSDRARVQTSHRSREHEGFQRSAPEHAIALVAFSNSRDAVSIEPKEAEIKNLQVQIVNQIKQAQDCIKPLADQARERGS